MFYLNKVTCACTDMGLQALYLCIINNIIIIIIITIIIIIIIIIIITLKLSSTMVPFS